MRAVLVLVLCAVAVDAQMRLTSPAFPIYGDIPEQYGCDRTFRDDYRPSPPLEWTRVPVAAKSFVLVMEDVDNDGAIQWLVSNIPHNVTSLPHEASEFNMPPGSVELMNSRGVDSFSGPCPPFNSTHSYRFRLFAMPTAHTHIELGDRETTRANDIVEQIQENAVVVAVYAAQFHLGPYTNISSPNPHRYRNMILPGQTFRGINATRNATRPHMVKVDGPLPTHRFVKPSEALKPQRQHNEVTTSRGRGDDPDCIVDMAERMFHNVSSNSTEGSMHTQALVSESVESFQHEVDLWSCEEEYRRNAGVRVVGNETQRCALRSRVTDSKCDAPQFPRQFVCDTHGSSGFGLSPSLMWKDAPDGTQSFIVMVEESSSLEFVQDYGRVFWLVTDIPASESSIDAGASRKDGVMPPLSVEHRNSFDTVGYTAPCPGDHERRVYRLKVFAMPHATTKLFPRYPLHATEVTQQLQKQALCMSTVELAFSFRSSPATEPRHVSAKAAVVADTAGEFVEPIVV